MRQNSPVAWAIVKSPESRILWVKITVGIGMLAGLLLSRHLWLSARSYPMTPVLPFLRPIGPPLDSTIFVALLLLLMAIVSAPRPKALVWAAIALAVTLALFDQSRWQPWFYQYLFMLIAVGLYPEGRDAPLDTCRLIVVCIYFWSGLQKLNPQFLGDVFPWMIEPIDRFLPAAILRPIGMAAPFLETGIGIALLSNRCRNIAVIGALAMHAFILLAVGPLGHNVNTVVWPWNLAMASLVVILFWRTNDFSSRNILWRKGFVFHLAVLVLFGIAPLFSFFNLWDNYLSSALYAGNRNAATLYLSDAVADKLPDAIQAYVTENGPNINELDLADWSWGELNVPPYPELRVYENVARTICGYATTPSQVKMVVKGKVALVHGGKEYSYDCSNVGK